MGLQKVFVHAVTIITLTHSLPLSQGPRYGPGYAPGPRYPAPGPNYPPRPDYRPPHFNQYRGNNGPPSNYNRIVKKPSNDAPARVNYPPDLRGRSRRHPKGITRFQKYFPGPPQCTCEYPENPLNYGPRPKEEIVISKPAPDTNPTHQHHDKDHLHDGFFHHDDLHQHLPSSNVGEGGQEPAGQNSTKDPMQAMYDNGNIIEEVMITFTFC